MVSIEIYFGLISAIYAPFLLAIFITIVLSIFSTMTMQIIKESWGLEDTSLTASSYGGSLINIVAQTSLGAGLSELLLRGIELGASKPSLFVVGLLIVFAMAAIDYLITNYVLFLNIRKYFCVRNNLHRRFI